MEPDIHPGLMRFLKARYSNLLLCYQSVFKKENDWVHGAMHNELTREASHINMIASESLASEAVLLSWASLVHNQTIEGVIGKRWYPYTEAIDSIERLASRYACDLFGMPAANVQPHSATQANQAVMLATLKPGCRVLAMSFVSGGHLSHGFGSSLASRLFEIHTYEVPSLERELDYEYILRRAKAVRPHLIISGSSAYPRPIEFARVSAIAEEVKAIHLADMSHVAGMVASGLHPAVSSASFATTSLHKTLCGPRGGIILYEPENGASLSNAVFPGAQGAVMPNLIAAKLVALEEAMRPSFRTLQEEIISNARSLAAALIDGGIEVYTGGTDTHLVLMRLPANSESASMVARLERVGILCNRNFLPGDRASSKQMSGLRFGTTWITQLGFHSEDVHRVGELIVECMHSSEPDVPSLRSRCMGLLDDVVS